MNLIKRNELGLVEGVNYKYTPEGFIDWRYMIDPKHLYVNTESFQRRGEVVPVSVDGVADKDLIATLAGLKNLAALRGFTSVTYRPVVASNEYVATVCRIEWIGNFETNMVPIAFEDCACANLYNVSELVQSYLMEMSANRAYARAIRNFLKISIVAKEELPPAKKIFNPKTNSNSKSNPAIVLAELMKEKGRAFKEVKDKMLAEGNGEFENYQDWNDIPGEVAFKLIDRFKNLKEVKVKTGKG